MRRKYPLWHPDCSAPTPQSPQGAQALGKREESAAGPAESQRGEIAEQPLRALGQRRSDGKRRNTRLKPWALFQLIGELSVHRPHPRPPPRCRKKRGRGNRRKIPRAHARTSPSFGFLPSPICSNPVEHNALGVKISRISTHTKQPATHSESTSCG